MNYHLQGQHLAKPKIHNAHLKDFTQNPNENHHIPKLKHQGKQDHEGNRL
jgi:hypothetical protein